jgi:hypothetical protein
MAEGRPASRLAPLLALPVWLPLVYNALSPLSGQRDTLLSYATKSIGHGKGFGLHEALDQIGAVAAPLLLAAVLAWQGSYALAFALLLIPGALSVVVLLIARARFPQPEDLAGTTPALTTSGFDRTFWLYLSAVGLIAAGFADFPLIAFHLQRAAVLPTAWIPALYALAMAVDAGAALLFGALFDRISYRVLTLAALLSVGFAPLAFSGSLALVVLGMVLWGARPGGAGVDPARGGGNNGVPRAARDGVRPLQRLLRPVLVPRQRRARPAL